MSGDPSARKRFLLFSPTALKLVLLGDDGVGKTSLLIRYRDGQSPPAELPVIAPNFAKQEVISNTPITLVLWDSACGDDYAVLRPRAYPETDFFVFCFALNDPASLAHLSSKWQPEVASAGVRAPIILVATKSDARTMADKAVSPTRRQLLPRYFAEVSARSGDSVTDLFATIARIAVEPERVPAPVAPEPEPAPAPASAPASPPRPALEANAPSKSCLLL
jgi:small GTP-binding protein